MVGLLRRNAFRLPRQPASVGLARLRVREHLTAWGRTGDAVDAAMLVVSELATNAVRHGALGDREFEVAVTALGDGSCFVEVTDSGRRPPVPRAVGDEDESGRGLHLVEALAETWGVWHRGCFGKTVWAVLGPPAADGTA
ncbi:ATP-binding protein [Streptomyces sp. NPDC057654]|uniref:ATP-binding protein n=1 Tax=Streptomyces sp. NPDC057654 TaxID=3346196 RepID=UPI0036A2FAA6